MNGDGADGSPIFTGPELVGEGRAERAVSAEHLVCFGD